MPTPFTPTEIEIDADEEIMRSTLTGLLDYAKDRQRAQLRYSLDSDHVRFHTEPEVTTLTVDGIPQDFRVFRHSVTGDMSRVSMILENWSNKPLEECLFIGFRGERRLGTPIGDARGPIEWRAVPTAIRIPQQELTDEARLAIFVNLSDGELYSLFGL